MSDARIINTAARLVRGTMLSPLFTICETQHQVSTAKLERYLEDVADHLKTCAFEIHMGYDFMKKESKEQAEKLSIMVECADNYSRMFEEVSDELAKARELLVSCSTYLTDRGLHRKVSEFLERNQ